MERAATMRRPQGVVAKLMGQQPMEMAGTVLARGNQKLDDDDDDDEDRNGDGNGDAPEQVDDSEGEENDRDVGSSVRKFDDESSSSSSILGYTMATPPSSPESHKATHNPEAVDDSDASSSEKPMENERRESGHSETDASLAEDVAINLSTQYATDDSDHHQLQRHQQHEQLQSDVEVLAAHLQQQTLALTHEHSVNKSLQSQLLATQQTLVREMADIRIENDALRHENARLLAERDASQQHAQTVSETHDELLRALRVQQQRDDHARTIIASLVKERDALKKQLDESKMYCRRLEEDALGLRAEQQQLRAETQSLQTVIKAASSHRNDRELQLIREQEEIIQSLRADVLQMEFEYRTLSVDKDKLSHRVTTLQRQSESRSTKDYDVISLRNDGDKKKTKHDKTKKRLSVSTATSSKDNSSGGSIGFTNLMTLPNCVNDSSSTNTLAPLAMTGTRPRTPMGSLMSKTISSAKKKLFQSATHTATVVLPQ